MGWQPIDTAPKDSTEIIIMYHVCKYVDVGFWWDDGWYCREEKLSDPLYWMPIPPPPAGSP